MKYAKNTEVSAEKSRAEIEKTLTRYGAVAFGYAWEGTYAIVMFQMHQRRLKFVLPMPDKSAREFTHTPGKGLRRHPDDAHREWEQATRQRWRALLIAIKAKLEAVECGITTFEEEFMAHIVLPSGQTVGDWMSPQIEKSYETGVMPPMMLSLPAPK